MSLGFDSEKQETECADSPIARGGSDVFGRVKTLFKRLFDPTLWGLQKRFLLTTGLLLVFGAIALSGFVYLMTSTNLEASIQGRVQLVCQSLEDQLHTQRDLLLTTVTFVSSMPEVKKAMAARNREELKDFILPFVEKIRLSTGNTSLYFHFHLPPAISFLRTWDVSKFGDDLSFREMVVKANRDLTSLTGIEIGAAGPVLRSISPVISEGKHLGSVEAAINIVEAVQEINLPQGYGISVLIDQSRIGKWERPATTKIVGKWMILRCFGDADSSLSEKILKTDSSVGWAGYTFFRCFPVNGVEERRIGQYIISYNGADETAVNNRMVAECVWVFMLGAAVLWFSLYWNLFRVRVFLQKMRKIIIASQSNQFVDRFSNDPVHCLHLLKCGNTECPVYKNPALVCYLETGSEAISPTMRNTCVFLSKYSSCAECPVYMRNHDELADLGNVINTMMRIWSLFLGRVGILLSEILQTGDQLWHLPSLDQVSEYLDQMAKLAAFSHDLRGVYNQQEVYKHLSFFFENHFGMNDYCLLEVSGSDNRLNAVIRKSSGSPMLSHEVIINSDLCRAKRTGEDVCSSPNPVMCPYFDCDHERYIRCCLPMLMGGKVGGVFSFVVPREQWDTMRKQLVMLRRFLDETAPVLSSLRLLEVTKEQSLRDQLTQCLNRRFLDEYMVQYEPMAKRDGQNVGFIMADMDFFKQVNDQHGHQAGDSVLQQTAKLLQQNIRRSDLLIRYGGEEFLILLLDIGTDASESVAEKIRSAIEMHEFILPDGSKIRKTISLGVSEFPKDGDALYKIIKFSDVALYSAKKAGRNRVEVFNPGMWTEDQY